MEAEVELGQHIQEVLVEDVEDEEGVAAVGLAAVEEEEWLQVLEFPDGVVGTSCGLLAFFSEDSDANVRLQDHADVIGSVADREGRLLRIATPHHVDDIGLLLR